MDLDLTTTMLPVFWVLTTLAVLAAAVITVAARR